MQSTVLLFKYWDLKPVRRHWVNGTEPVTPLYFNDVLAFVNSLLINHKDISEMSDRWMYANQQSILDCVKLVMCILPAKIPAREDIDRIMAPYYHLFSNIVDMYSKSTEREVLFTTDPLQRIRDLSSGSVDSIRQRYKNRRDRTREEP